MNKGRLEELKELVGILNTKITDWQVLNEALTHRTFVAENQSLNLQDNQRLEFLGDAILGMIVAEYLFAEFQERPEGDLTRMRAAVVCEDSLANQAIRLNLGKYMLLGKGEEMSGGRTRPSILADAVEAIIGAVYLDQGLDEVRQMILFLFMDEIESVAQGGFRDYKTMLQELIHRLYSDEVTYQILQETGPDHNKRYEAGVFIKGKLLTKGKGRSKKEAEQQGAQRALKKLKTEH